MKQEINDPIDRFFSSVDQIRLLIESNRTKNYRPNPAKDTSENNLTDNEKAHSAALMRINHAGEIAAQGLYQGHAVFTQNPSIKEQMDNNPSGTMGGGTNSGVPNDKKDAFVIKEFTGVAGVKG